MGPYVLIRIPCGQEMGGEVFILVFLVSVWKAQAQTCPGGTIFPGQLKPSLLPSTIEQCGCRHQDLLPTECKSCGPNSGCTVSFSSLKNSMTCGNLEQTESGCDIKPSKCFSNFARPFSSFSGPCSSTCESPLPTIHDAFGLKIKPTNIACSGQQFRPLCMSKASCVENIPKSISATDSQCFNNLPSQSNCVCNNPCNTCSSPSVIVDDNMVNTLPLYLPNCLLESSLEYAQLCPRTGSNEATTPFVKKLNPCNIVSAKSPNACGCNFNKPLNPNFCCSNQGYSEQSTYSFSEATNSLNSNNQFGPTTATSATAISEVSSINNPSGPTNAYKRFNNIASPVSSSISFADASNSVSTPFRTSSCGNLCIPSGSSLGISVEPYRDQSPNLCAINGKITSSPFVPDINLFKVDSCTGYNNNMCGSLTNLVSTSSSTCGQECKPISSNFCGISKQYTPSCLSIIEVPQCNPFQMNFVSCPNINPCMTDTFGSIGYNPCCSPSLAESTPVSKSSLSISEVTNPISCGTTESASSISSSTSVTKINTVASVDTNCSPCASSTPSSSTVSSCLVSSSSPSFELSSINCVPLIYELQIPSSIPAQLSCNLANCDSCSPVSYMCVEPFSY